MHAHFQNSSLFNHLKWSYIWRRRFILTEILTDTRIHSRALPAAVTWIAVIGACIMQNKQAFTTTQWVRSLRGGEISDEVLNQVSPRLIHWVASRGKNANLNQLPLASEMKRSCCIKMKMAASDAEMFGVRGCSRRSSSAWTLPSADRFLKVTVRDALTPAWLRILILISFSNNGPFINGAVTLLSRGSDLEVKKVSGGTFPPWPAGISGLKKSVKDNPHADSALLMEKKKHLARKD